MGTLFRSQPMTMVNIFISFEAAHDVVEELGALEPAAIQFRDLNPGTNAFARNFVNEVKRIDEMENHLNYFISRMQEEQIDFPDFIGSAVNINGDKKLLSEDPESTNLSLLADLESNFEKISNELKLLEQGLKGMQRNVGECMEEQALLNQAHHDWFAAGGAAQQQLNSSSSDSDAGESISLLGGGDGQDTRQNLGYVAGVVNKSKIASFERVLWRTLMGNMVMRYTDIEELIPDFNTKSHELTEKVAFIVFYTSSKGCEKIEKLCDAFKASRYACPEEAHVRTQRIEHLTHRLQDLNRILDVNKNRSNDMLVNTVRPNIYAWRVRVLKEKAIYHTMNLFDYDVQRTTLIAEGWVPDKNIGDVQNALTRASQRSRALVEPVLHVIQTTETPPTYFETNKFSKSFQDIVDAYGVARYQEVNPAPFSIISFPFLFGVMFGDLGHGTLMLLFALFLVIKEKSLGQSRLNEMVKTCYDGRYVLLLMSLFAMYMGFLYNECFAVPLNFFGVDMFEYPHGNPAGPEYLRTYPVGVSPAWKIATNNLLYYNSLKMKMSILIGVSQMVFGICLSAANGWFFRKKWQEKYNIVMEFIPQMVFMLSIFGYMCFLIVYKWAVNWMNWVPPADHPNFETPKLLNLLIAMFQGPGKLQWEYDIYAGQHAVQVVLLIAAVLAVPWMLIPKPYLLRHEWRKRTPNWREIEAAGKGEAAAAPSTSLIDDDPSLVIQSDAKHGKHHKRKGKKYQKLVDDYSSSSSDADLIDPTLAKENQNAVIAIHEQSHGEDDEEEFDFGEVFVHQMIHTIEFVLGAVSNTASYLRLWALSLAHAELSEVFLDKVAVLTLGMVGKGAAINVIAIWIGFGAWAGLTVGVLLMMESLSAFLHALRLHWVEFQNKFYNGGGYAFVPFSFKRLLRKTDDDD
eukprot:CAMPEP_0201552272 /NCGR_PEP_ID=MMETSP0173_2-20130828/14590_1 /ASSEMBLY_ACC=CAM_ASM_000268 /TAXON_ID=218659 /ORGANISM="Vexillifera sp., Strain DIVA3 564/2" /LENGTH=910 /DNA_ID=CAMNT_0047962725 /DNA_START=22 /DNA_END=2754 /DNA_ORIENTATION=+